MSEYRDKLRSLGFSTRKGTSKTTKVQHDRTGETIGTQTEHWDGRQDATAFAPRVHIKSKPAEEIRD